MISDEEESRIRFVASDLLRQSEVFFACENGTEQVRKTLQILAVFFSNTVEGIVITDPLGTIKMVNPAFTFITGYGAEEVIGRNPRILKSDRHSSEFYKKLWDSLLNDGKWEGEIWNRRKNGEVYPEWLSCFAVYDEKEEVTDYIALFNDLSEVKFKDAQIGLRSKFDQLTGLSDRIVFFHRLEGELERRKHEGKRMALFVLDINRFKNINDSLGYFVGDAVLQEVGKRLCSHLGGKEKLSRIGADDFHMFLSDVRSVEEIASRAEHILGLLNEPVDVEGHQLFLSVSLGIAVFPEDGSVSDTLLKKADMAMHKAKDFGISTYRFFTGELGELASSKLLMENALRSGLEKGEFYLVYQPKYSFRENRVSGMEALLRWKRPERIVSPEEFIALAEETGLIHPLGKWVFREACRQMAEWREAGVPFDEVAVNLSARQFHQQGLLSMIKASMDEFSIDPSFVGVEITESGIMEGLVNSVSILSDLKDLGVTVYVDDFGTGYSSLNYLKRLPIDVLKIDKSFVDGVLTDKNDAAITMAVIGLGRSLGMSVVAEGVETKEQLGFLRRNGCDGIQGYLLSKPLSPAEFALFRKKEMPLCFQEISGYNQS